MGAELVDAEYVGGPLDGVRVAVTQGSVGPAGSRVVIVWLRGPPATYVVHDDARGLCWRYVPGAHAA